MSRTPRRYLGHKFGMPGCPIFIRRHMQSLVKIVRAVFENLPKRLYVWKKSPKKSVRKLWIGWDTIQRSAGKKLAVVNHFSPFLKQKKMVAKRKETKVSRPKKIPTTLKALNNFESEQTPWEDELKNHRAHWRTAS